MIQEANLPWFYLDTENNLIMPNYTLECLRWISDNVKRSWKVFEYGSGYSSIWWRSKCQYFAVESNIPWARAMNVTHRADKHSYIEACRTEDGLHDCIVVDGIHRQECIAFCMQYIKPGGFLLIDNYDETDSVDDWVKIDEILSTWTKTIFRQHNHTDWKTAVFKKPE
jgi:hypothetical protein